ncbi:MAG: anti-sigma factor [Geminicoccaceae bacterium]|nr:anti-sigma factor [Geminicoccaceae bacterium]
MTSDQLRDAELHAFVDGHLSPDQRRRVMASLAASPEQAGRASDYRSINEALHLSYDEVLHEPLPGRLRVERYGQPAGSGGLFVPGAARSAVALRAAALVALALTSGVAGWSLNDRLSSTPVETAAPSFTQMAAFAHQLYAPEANYPVEFGGDQQDTLLLWLSERLGTPVRAPNLQAIGFRLVGGRLLPSHSGDPAGQLMYESQPGKRITLYIRGRAEAAGGRLDAEPSVVRYGEEHGVSIVYWEDPDLAYVLIGPMDRDELLATALTVQKQLEIPALPPVVPTTVEPDTSKGAT